MSFRPETGDVPIGIPQAYAELSRGAFSVWIRMSHIADEDMAKGRRAIAEICGYSQAQMNRILTELRRKKYIAIEPPERVGIPTRLSTPKRPMLISYGNRFFRF